MTTTAARSTRRSIVRSPGRRMVTGVALLAITAAGLALGVGGRAGAQATEEPATVGREAYFTYPLTQVTPPLLRAGFPPSTVCLVAGLLGVPQICGEEIQEIAGILGLSDGLPIPVTPDGEIIQPVVVPGTTPVGMVGGQARWVSLMQLRMPTLPEGEQLSNFELVLRQDGLNFAVESPAFRQIVFALISQLSEQDPATLLEDLAHAFSDEVELFTQSITGIEACPITEPWDGGDAQGAGLDGTRLPDVDCLRGTTGTYDPGAGTWTFDLTFAAQAWTSGDETGEVLPNNGVMLRPVGAPNLAYGDPDLSTNWLVSLADGDATGANAPLARFSTRPEAPGISEPIEPTPVEPVSPVSPPSDLDTGDLPAPAAPAPSPPADLTGAISARWADDERGPVEGSLPAWLWLLLPTGAAGAFLFAQSLVAAPAVTRRPGALTRLVGAGATAGGAAGAAGGTARPPQEETT